MCQLFFDEESIYEISKLYLNQFCNGHTDAGTHGQAESNMPLQLFQSWGHNKMDLDVRNPAFRVSDQVRLSYKD